MLLVMQFSSFTIIKIKKSYRRLGSKVNTLAVDANDKLNFTVKSQTLVVAFGTRTMVDALDKNPVFHSL